MKAVLASLATAAVLAGAAWAGNITPGNVSALTKKVNQLQAQETALAARLNTLETTTACLQQQWNATGFQPYIIYSWSGFATKSGSASLFTAPSQPDGINGSGYLLWTSQMGSSC